eukprot:s173_g27.t1
MPPALCRYCGEKWPAVGGGLCQVCRTLDGLAAVCRGPAIPPEAEGEVLSRLRNWVADLQDLGELCRGVAPNPVQIASQGCTPKAPPGIPAPPPVPGEGGGSAFDRLPAKDHHPGPGEVSHPPPVKEEHPETAKKEKRSRRRQRSAESSHRERKRSRRSRSGRERPRHRSERLASPVRPARVKGESTESDRPERRRERKSRPLEPRSPSRPPPDREGAPRSPSRPPPAREADRLPTPPRPPVSGWTGPIRAHRREPAPGQGVHFGKNKGKTKRERQRERPAAAPKAQVRGDRRGRRRPAAREDRDNSPSQEVIQAAQVTLEQCRELDEIEVVKGSYWESEVQAVLKVREAVIRQGELFLKAQVMGTQNESLLRAASNRPDRDVEAHLCPRTCTGGPHAEGVVHVSAFRKLGREREPWMTNMVPEEKREVVVPRPPDELDEIRADMQRLQGPLGGGDGRRQRKGLSCKRHRREEGQEKEEEQKQATAKEGMEGRRSKRDQSSFCQDGHGSRPKCEEEVSAPGFKDRPKEGQRFEGEQQLLQLDFRERRRDVVRLFVESSGDWQTSARHVGGVSLGRGGRVFSDSRGRPMGNPIGAPAGAVQQILQTAADGENGPPDGAGDHDAVSCSRSPDERTRCRSSRCPRTEDKGTRASVDRCTLHRVTTARTPSPGGHQHFQHPRTVRSSQACPRGGASSSRCISPVWCPKPSSSKGGGDSERMASERGWEEQRIKRRSKEGRRREGRERKAEGEWRMTPKKTEDEDDRWEKRVEIEDPCQLAPGKGGEARETYGEGLPLNGLIGNLTCGSPDHDGGFLLGQPSSCQTRVGSKTLDELRLQDTPAGVQASQGFAEVLDDHVHSPGEFHGHYEAPTKLGAGLPCSTVEPEDRALKFAGKVFADLGGSLNEALQQLLWEQHGKILTMAVDKIYPLPLGDYPGIHPSRTPWMSALLQALNSLYGCPGPATQRPTEVQKELVLNLSKFVDRMWAWEDCVPTAGFGTFFDVKGVDYRGEEIKLARPFTWESISGALPKEVGTLELAQFCVGGCRHYVEEFENYLLPPEEQLIGRPPRVMVHDDSWFEVCPGLIAAGICKVVPRHALHHVGDTPLLNGLFSVSKNEFSETGVELHRLIMNMVPVNKLCRSLKGDVGTLPTLAGLSAFYLEDTEVAVLSSEDIKCFYYLFKLPTSWHKFMGFAKEVPSDLVPKEFQDEPCHLTALVLPMGFLNSVGIAQHVHRNVVRWSLQGGSLGGAEQELRRDRPAPNARELYRVYLDNWDQLRKVDVNLVDEIEGKPTVHQLALRQQYLDLDLPRHPKKSVESSTKAEIQGALLDGREGVAHAKPEKILKYMGLGWELVQRGSASLREIQVVAGGFVYITMFRRPLLCALNEVWHHVEDLKGYPPVVRLPLPQGVKVELIRFMCLIPLAQMDFRLPMMAQVTASDASSTGGGLSCSIGLTDFGVAAEAALVRGEWPEPLEYTEVLTVGLFDGIGALRVAADALHLPMAGHISVECNTYANRVLESAFPGSRHVDSVQDVTPEEVTKWACEFSSVGVILLGAGPPCQGVSQLNVDRKGSQRDERSSLYKEIPRVASLLKAKFPWAQVHTFVESVASMDAVDRAAMSGDLELLPNRVDSVGVSLARRPRLYWCTWELVDEDGLKVMDYEGLGWQALREISLEASVDQRLFLQAGWFIPPGFRLATFTTSRPSATPGRRPAGLHTCDSDTVARWRADLHRYPPYQYKPEYGVHHSSGEVRVPSILEREVILGFPAHYTAQCVAKVDRKAEWVSDVRKTLLGNSWSVPVVCCLLKQLFERLGVIPFTPIQTLVDRLAPGNALALQAVLQRPPIHRETARVHPEDGLARRLSGLVSIKGEDLLLQATSEQTIKYHRLRASIPSRLWKWREVAGWAWQTPGDHINQLEMRAVLTSAKYWIQKRRLRNCKLLHLTDSLVVLHALSKKRLEGRNPQERQKVRKQMGTLKQLTIQPKTRQRYDRAKSKFYAFLHQNKVELPRERSVMDSLLCDYLEHLWASGEGRALASDTLASLQDTSPKLRGSIPGAWRLLKTWQVNEIPCRAPPLPERVLQALVGYFIFKHQPQMALSLLLGFYSMLRTGELLGVRARDVTVDVSHGNAVVSLGFTKGGKRTGAAESVTVTVSEVIRRLSQWKKHVSPGSNLTPPPHTWRKNFAAALSALHLEKWEFRPYSLRRGGATFWFAQHGSLDRILLQGRWMAAKTARTYLNEGLAVLTEIDIPPAKLNPFHTVFVNAQRTALPSWPNA